MKKLLLSIFIIFLSMNILAHDSEISRMNEILELVSKFDQKPAAFKFSSKACDAEFIRIWLSTSGMESKIWNFNNIVYPHICEELKRDPEINIAFVEMSPYTFFENIDPKLVSNYDELAKIAVSRDAEIFKIVKPEELSNPEVYDELAKIAVSQDVEIFKIVKPEELSNPEVYDELADTAVIRDRYGRVKLEHVKPEALINPKLYDKLALTTVDRYSWNLSYAEPEHLNNYDELVKIAMDVNIENVKRASISGVYNLEETKREDLLNFIKSYQCNFLKRITDVWKCEDLDQWLKDYEVYQKKQEIKRAIRYNR